MISTQVAELDPDQLGGDVTEVFLASLKLLGDNAQLDGDLGSAFDAVARRPPGGGGARTEDAWHRRNAAADWAGERVPLQQDLILELRHTKLELRHHATRLVWGAGAAPPRQPERACVELNRRVDLHAIDAPPARRRGDVGSSPLDGASAATSSPRNDFVKNYR